MYGVVLWSDIEERKAVIWCEDHGDLAFYSGQCDLFLDGPLLDAGDLVYFQISEGQEMRLASNPRLVAEQQFPNIAQRLKANGTSNTVRPATPTNSAATNVIHFSPRQTKTSIAC